jgi:uncharacterized protein GlcG (DUF336 family)
MKTIKKESINLNAANTLALAAIKKAEELNFAIAVCIVDESGVLKTFHRMDGAPLIAQDASRKKAITAVGFGMSTGDAWFDFIKDDPILREGAASFDDFILVGGGSAIFSGDAIVGAIGISGGHYKQDEACVEAALEAFKNM